MKEQANKGKVLIIDDTVSIIDMVKTALEDRNYQVLVATSGKKGIKSAIIAQPDLILLDILMPDMDGYETCNHLKNNENTNEIPVIFMSALFDVFDKVKAFNIGGVDYITKPINIEELQVRVNTQIKLFRLQRQLKDTNILLEQKVEKRTSQLRLKNEELQATKEELIASNDSLKETNEQLEESKHRYNLLSDLNIEGIVIHKNGYIYDVNKAFCNILGVTKEHAVGKNLIPFHIHPDDIEMLLKNIKSNSTKPYQVRAFKQNKTPIIIELESRFLKYKSVNAQTTAIRDITLKVEQEKALKASEERYSNLLNLSHEGFYGWNITEPMPLNLPIEKQINWLADKAILRECNQAYANFMGYKTPEELIGKSFKDIISSEQLSTYILKNLIDDNLTFKNRELKLITQYNKVKYSLENT